MEDSKIIELFFARDESALLNASAKYGTYLHKVAFNIVNNTEDAQECTNDTLLKAWNSIPPQLPENLKAYLAKISRNLALDRYDRNSAQKRGGGVVETALEELEECIAGDPDIALLDGAAERVINGFLETLDQKKRVIFVRRYFYLDSVKDIAKKYSLTESSVKTTLYRVREELRDVLKKEGINV